jgi:uncharacterized membrane protein
MKKILLSLTVMLSVATVGADTSTLDAAIGGGLGGAAGAAIGNEVGGRDGAIIGGAVGAAVGTAVTTDPNSRHAPRRSYRYDAPPPRRHRSYHFCPPGQAKKGRC